MNKFKTVAVDRADLAHYRRRAEECSRISEQALKDRLWFGACINAIHAGIAYADCLSIFLRGLRYAGSSHDEAIRFYSTLQINRPEFRQSVQNFGKLISIKNSAEYSDGPLTEKDAQLVHKTILRFRDFILSRLP